MLIFLICLPIFIISFLFFTEYNLILNNDYNPFFEKFKYFYFYITKIRNFHTDNQFINDLNLNSDDSDNSNDSDNSDNSDDSDDSFDSDDSDYSDDSISNDDTNSVSNNISNSDDSISNDDTNSVSNNISNSDHINESFTNNNNVISNDNFTLLIAKNGF